MGACASKSKVLKEDADAPPPVQKEEVVDKEVKVAEEACKCEEPAADDDSAKRQSLGLLFDKNEGGKASAENDDNTSETTKLTELLADAPVKAEAENAPEVAPVTDLDKSDADITVTPENKSQEKPAEAPKLETSQDKKMEDKEVQEKHVVETPKTENLEEKKPEAKEQKKTEEKLAADAGKPKAEEDKPSTPEAKV